MNDEVTGGGSTPVESTPAASTPTTVDATLDQAYAELTAAPAEPAKTEPAAQEGIAPTTAEPPKGDVQPGPEGKEGPIPFAAHKTALENARTKAAQETEQRLLQQLQQELAPYVESIKFAQSLQANPGEALAAWLEARREDPTVRAALARSFAGLRGQKTAEADPEPPRFADGPNGELIFDPAVDQKWREWNDRRIERQLLAKIDEQYAPIKQSFEEQRKQREAAAELEKYTAQADRRAKAHAETLKQLPFVNEHKDAINARQQDIFAEMKRKALAGELEIDPTDAPRQAWLQAYAEIAGKAIPQRDAALQAKTQQQFVQTAATKTRGSQSDPAASAPAQPRRGRTPDEALDLAYQQFRSA